MNKIRKGDDVIVLTGRDKGKRVNVARSHLAKMIRISLLRV
ncbi:MAG: hypothetical protein RLZZ371_1983 [Pseudomonadota bacterium]